MGLDIRMRVQSHTARWRCRRYHGVARQVLPHRERWWSSVRAFHAIPCFHFRVDELQIVDDCLRDEDYFALVPLCKTEVLACASGVRAV